MEQAIAQLSPVFIETVTAIIGACLVFIAARAHSYISKMNLSETFKNDLYATNDQVVTSLKKIVAISGADFKQKLADGKLTASEMIELKDKVYKAVKVQIPDVEKRLEVHVANGGEYVVDTILGEIESANNITNL